jgi:hypothetical protein
LFPHDARQGWVSRQRKRRLEGKARGHLK